MKKISDEIDPHALPTVRLKSLWVLDHFSGSPMATSSIVKELLKLGISTSPQAVTYSLSKKNGAFHKGTSGYIIMGKGRNELMSARSTNDDKVIYIEAGKPFTGKAKAISSIFSKLSGEIKICDPYIDMRTLQVVFQNLDKSLPVKILTQTINDKPAGTISNTLKELRKEGYTVEVRVNHTGTLHDRYIMDRSVFWYSGNSLNGLGNKESLLISLGADVRQSMLALFDTHWKKASTIQ